MKFIKAMLVALFAMLLSFGAAAQTAPDYTTMTSAVSFTGVITAILAVGATLVGIYVVWKGIKFILRMVKAG